jgi:DNA-binding HxlR family transcriptional regulator
MPLVIAELLEGSTRFSDIRRGVPLMSQTLLSQRLKELERVGIVERRGEGNRAREWHLTEAGAALGPVIQQLGEWGLRFAQDPLAESDLDGAARHRVLRIHRRARGQESMVAGE